MRSPNAAPPTRRLHLGHITVAIPLLARRTVLLSIYGPIRYLRAEACESPSGI
jgi:hypothetical protein